MFVVLLNNHTRILAPIYFGFVNNSERLIKTNNIYIYIYIFFFHFILSKIIVYVTSFIDMYFFLAVLTTSAKIIFGLDLFNFLNWNQYNNFVILHTQYFSTINLTKG